MRTHACRAATLAAPISLATFLWFATPAFAGTSDISTADTAWMIVATALVLMMTIPGLALFYSGMVRKKNVLATMAQSLAAVTIISILWVAFGYSLSLLATVRGSERSIAGSSPAWPWTASIPRRRPSRNACSCSTR
jgi:hypothetical protein